MENLFDENRWRRAGADDDEVATLREEFAAMPIADQQGQAAWLEGVSDADVRAYLDARREANFETSDDGDVEPVEEPEKPKGRTHATQRDTTGDSPTAGADSGPPSAD